MGKKKDIKKWRKAYRNIVDDIKDKSKASLNKEFKDVLEDIEDYRFKLYEADKKKHRKRRKNINKEAKAFYTEMESVKVRKKLSKKWEKNGFLNTLINLLKEITPLIQLLAKAVASLIISFLSLDRVKSVIKPKTIERLQTIFNIAIAL